MKFTWKQNGQEHNLHCGRRKTPCATVWGNGTWHTWDSDGVGGENASERTVAEAKRQAMASAIIQGFTSVEIIEEGAS